MPSTRRHEILSPKVMPRQHVRSIRSETRATLAAAIARGRRWLDELTTDPSITTESIAKRENSSIPKDNVTILLAYLAPDLVKAATANSRTACASLASPTSRPNGPAVPARQEAFRYCANSGRMWPCCLRSFGLVSSAAGISRGLPRLPFTWHRTNLNLVGAAKRRKGKLGLAQALSE
jgi:hypothetical protein